MQAEESFQREGNVTKWTIIDSEDGKKKTNKHTHILKLAGQRRSLSEGDLKSESKEVEQARHRKITA
jgi:hypothetical protein